eukprot:Nk52_evm18s967 gene=Nk52_evmTU18s967
MEGASALLLNPLAMWNVTANAWATLPVVGGYSLGQMYNMAAAEYHSAVALIPAPITDALDTWTGRAAAYCFAGFILLRLNKMRKKRVACGTVLELDFTSGNIQIQGEVEENPIQEIMNSKAMSLRDFIRIIDRAGDDDRISGIVAYFGNSSLKMLENARTTADLQEIRAAIKRFSEKSNSCKNGKFTIAHANTFGLGFNGLPAYYLASAFEDIYLQHIGYISFAGLLVETPFVKRMLEKIGLEFQGDHRHEYKNMLNVLTETEYTAPHREVMEDIVKDWSQVVQMDIATARGLKYDAVKEVVQSGPYFADKALESGLIDGIKYRDEILDCVKHRLNKNSKVTDSEKLPSPQFLNVKNYGLKAGMKYDESYHSSPLAFWKKSSPTVAVIDCCGGIELGRHSRSATGQKKSMGSESICAAFRQALKNTQVKAIILRVDSGGGCAIASEEMGEMVLKAKKKGIPVVVSMGNMAGSGGYWISMYADKIVANSLTITGSIGVVMGKFFTPEFWSKVGITWDEVGSDPNSTFFTGRHKYDKDQWKVVQKGLDDLYDLFTKSVAEGRKLDLASVKKIAKGRVYMGVTAKDLGLVDELGGFYESVQCTKKILKLKPDDNVVLESYPRVGLLSMIKGPDSSFDPQVTTSVFGKCMQILLSGIDSSNPLFTLCASFWKIISPVVTSLETSSSSTSLEGGEKKSLFRLEMDSVYSSIGQN